MYATVASPFVESDVREITESIWSTVLGLSTHRLPAGHAFAEEDPIITGCVQLTGAWEGAVLIECSLPLARLAAGIVFHTDPSSLTVADLEDAIGELTNMHGGNLKALLPGLCYLSLPAVVHGLEHRLRIPGTVQLFCQPYDCGGEMFVLTVLNRSSS